MNKRLTPELINGTSETSETALISKNDLDDIELQVRERIEMGMSDEELRPVVSTLLAAKGLAPLEEGEKQRSLQLEIDGEVVEQTVFLDPSDFGTFVTPKNQNSASDVTNKTQNDRLLSRLGKIDMPNAGNTPEAQAGSTEEQEDVRLYVNAFHAYVDTFQSSLDQLDSAASSDDVVYIIQNFLQVTNSLSEKYPATVGSKSSYYSTVSTIDNILNDARYMFARVDEIAHEQGVNSGEFKDIVNSIRHHGLLGAMIDLKFKLESQY